MQTKLKCAVLLALWGVAAHNVGAQTLTGADVGVPSVPGSVTFADGKYTVVGNGSDIWGASDNFYYAYFQATGDFDYAMKVESLTGNAGDGGWSKVELMARLDDGSGVPGSGDPFIANMTTRKSSDTPSGGSAGVNYRGPQWRAVRDDQCTWTTPNPGYPPNMPNNWMRLERVGNVFYMYTSNDGTTWNMYNPYDPQGWDTSGSWPPGTDNPAVAFFSEAWPTTCMLGIAVTAHSDPDTTTAVVSQFGPYTQTPIGITTQPPATVSIAQNNKLELKVVVTGDPVHYQWRKDGTPIARAVGATYTVALAKPSDAGTYTCRVFQGGSKEIISSASVVTVTVDTQPPTIVKAHADISFTRIYIEFSEPVTASALTKGNYAVDKDITVNSVTQPTPNTAVLATSKMAEGETYTVTVNNIQDTAVSANTIAANSTVTCKSFVFAGGYATYERWDNSKNPDGADISLTDFIAAIADGSIRAPDISTSVAQFGGPWGASDYYSSRVSAFFIPPSNGDYVFFLASDDGSYLYLSTDDQPANKKIIAYESGWSNQYQWQTIGEGSTIEDKRSDLCGVIEWETYNTITLQAGKKYYIEILEDEGSGGDGSDATFIKSGESDPAQDASGMFLKGAVIGTYIDPTGASVTITTQPENTTREVDRKVVFSVTTTFTSPYVSSVAYQWQKAAAGSSTFADIAGATFANYTTPTLALADSGTQYRVVCSVPAFSKTSDIAILTVVPDTFPPIATAGALSGTGFIEIGVGFDEPVSEATASAAANYLVSSGTISNFKYNTASQSALLKVTGATAPIKVTVKNVADTKGNAIASTDIMVTPSPTLKWGVVGANEMGLENFVVPVASNGFDVFSDGIAESGTYDETTFVYESVTGDFDKKVRVEYQDNSSQWARAGIIVRDVLNFGMSRDEQTGDTTDRTGKCGRYQKCHVNPVGPTMTGPGNNGNAQWETNRRLTTGADTTSIASGGTPQYPDAWCRIQRVGQDFSCYRSDDGVNWTLIGTTTFDPAMPDTLFVGPEYSPENGNVTNEADRKTWVAKFRDYGDTFPFVVVEPTISIARDGKITFEGKLVSADKVTGPWTEVAGAASPYAVPAGTTVKFYRAAQ